MTTTHISVSLRLLHTSQGYSINGAQPCSTEAHAIRKAMEDRQREIRELMRHMESISEHHV